MRMWTIRDHAKYREPSIDDRYDEDDDENDELYEEAYHDGYKEGYRAAMKEYTYNKRKSIK